MRLGHAIPVGLVLLLIVAPSAAAAGGQDPGEMTYTVSPDELKLDYLEDGAFDLTLPGYGTVLVEGVSENPPSDPVYVRADDPSEVEVGKDIPGREGVAVPSPHPMIDGHVVGHPDSDADVVLGKYGIYGSIELNSTIFELNPRKASDGLYLQDVDTRAGPPPTPPKTASDPGNKLPEPPEPTLVQSHGESRSDVWMDLESSFHQNVGDPVSRVESAFNQYEDLFESTPTNVPLNLYGVYEHPGEITNGTVGDSVPGIDAAHEYRIWLNNDGGLISGVAAYQLWTGVDLTRDCKWETPEACLFGIAHDVDGADGHHGWARSSTVVEGEDHYFDGYDPDEVHDREIVSGHELGHLYGQEDHPDTDCDSGGPCTLMDSDGTDISDQNFDFVDNSEIEIDWRYHHQLEYDDAHH